MIVQICQVQQNDKAGVLQQPEQQFFHESYFCYSSNLLPWAFNKAVQHSSNSSSIPLKPYIKVFYCAVYQLLPSKVLKPTLMYN